MFHENACLIPWINISMHPMGDIRACCSFVIMDRYKKADGSLYNARYDSLVESRNCNRACEIRKDMMNGVKLKECSVCWDIEKIGGISKRMKMFSKYNHIIEKVEKYTNDDGSIDTDEIPILFYDLRTSNLCNCKCVFCFRENSSRHSHLVDWAEDDDNLFIKEVKESLNKVHTITFMGGEPLIINKYWELVDYMIENNIAKNIILRYFTNGTVLNKEMFEKWKHFKYVDLSFSLDAVGDKLKEIRPPSEWKNVKSNIESFERSGYENLSGNISMTISNFNLFHIGDVIEWFINKKDKKIKNIYGTVLRFPEEFSFIGKKELYEKVKPMYEKYLDMDYNGVSFIIKSIFEALRNENK